MSNSIAFSRNRAFRVISRALFVALTSSTLIACSNDFNRVADGDYTSSIGGPSPYGAGANRQPIPQRPMAGGNYVEQQTIAPLPAQSYPQQQYPAGYAQAPQGYPAQAGYPPQQTYPQQQVNYNQPVQASAPASARPTPSNMANGSYFQQQAVPAAQQPQPAQQVVVARPTPQVTAPIVDYTRSAPVSGQSVVVAPGDTLYSLSRRYNVTQSSLMAANGLRSPQDLISGRQIIIPGSTSSAPQQVQAPQQPTRFAEPQPFPQRAKVTQPVAPIASPTVAVTTAPAPRQNIVSGGGYKVATGDTLYGIARKHNVSVTQLTAVNNLGANTSIQPGQLLAIPVGQTQNVAAAPVLAAAPKAARLDAKPIVRVAAPVNNTVNTPAPVQVAAAQPAATNSDLSFRWPARGRVISTFGDKSSGQRNDGINLAVPAGTPVKAAEDGVVIYSGNELKSYGNLVLVRHANDWVTAYAHNSNLDVKRGDQVRRGQQIAQAGATGSVSSPQLRFEVRKGSTPVNPLDYLGGV